MPIAFLPLPKNSVVNLRFSGKKLDSQSTKLRESKNLKTLDMTDYLLASSTATAHATVAPTIGLLPSEKTGIFIHSFFSSSLPKKPYSTQFFGLSDNENTKIYFQRFLRFSYDFSLNVVNPLSIFEGWRVRFFCFLMITL